MTSRNVCDEAQSLFSVLFFHVDDKQNHNLDHRVNDI